MRATAFTIVLALSACGASNGEVRAPAPGGVLTVTSSAFAPNGSIPTEFTCEGEDVSPPLHWTGVPAGTKSFAVIVEDPDAPDPAKPERIWVHWIVYDIAGDKPDLEREAADAPPGEARNGTNDWGKADWGGPCPPIGRHRYFFRVFALDTELDNLGSEADKAALERAMKGHVLAKGELVGTYEKTKAATPPETPPATPPPPEATP
jgi:Raf kinase inhibitor-like YbhB/YbcL family protein